MPAPAPVTRRNVPRTACRVRAAAWPPARPCRGRVLRLLAGWLLGLLVPWLLPAGPAHAQAAPAPLVLHDYQPEVDPWPALTMWVDPQAAPAGAQVVGRLLEFRRPTQPRYNFGPARGGVLWLRLPLRLDAAAAGRTWWLRADYPDLDRIDVLLVDAGRVVDHQVMGHSLPCNERPLCASAHVAPLRLAPGRNYEVLLRVQAAAEQVVPLAVLRGDRLRAVERRSHLLGGLAVGFSLAVLLYALSHWVTLRERLFGYLALLAAGMTGSFLCQSGIGERLLWPGNVWMMREGGLVFGMATLAVACLTLDRLLDAPRTHRAGSWLLRGGAAGSVLLVLLRAAGAIDYLQVNLALAVLAQVPLVVGAWLAWLRARSGDRQARLVLAERLLQGGSTALFVGLILGWLPASFWTQHSYALATLGSFVVFCTIIVQRVEAVREAALAAQRRQEQLVAQAQVDALTGLPNRRSLQVLLERALAASSPQRPLALYLIDLDGFKPINDTHGHAAGDALLVAFAQRLGALVRSGDVVARLGGDEFVVLAPGVDAEAAQRLGLALLGSCAAAYDLGGLHCRVGLTIGWALAQGSATSAADLLMQADAALYAGKRGGRGCLVQAPPQALSQPGGGPQHDPQVAA
jgi:diguanylate cyclase (GGDEF)-like protein